MLKQIIGIHGFGNDRQQQQVWKKMSVAIESGAAETVILHTMVTEYPIIETDKSRPGACYSSAIGKPIPNLGEQRLLLSTEEGSPRASKALRIRQTHSPSWPWCGIRRGWLVHSQQDYRRAEVVHVGCLNAARFSCRSKCMAKY